nr:uncharacterized protein LOC109147522 [Ipomoea batatas]
MDVHDLEKGCADLTLEEEELGGLDAPVQDQASGKLKEAKVCNLMTASGDWDDEVVRDLFSSYDVPRILNTPISPNHHDTWCWKGDVRGQYTFSQFQVIGVELAEINNRNLQGLIRANLVLFHLWSDVTVSEYWIFSLGPSAPEFNGILVPA